MNQESQNIEWKESWHDEYLKWICGFANAQGGKIYIGKDDKGKVVGIANASKLMEDIPNKVREKTPLPVFNYDFSGFMVELGLKKRTTNNDSLEMSGKMSVEIVKSIKNNAHVTIPKLSETLGVTTRTIESHLKALKFIKNTEGHTHLFPRNTTFDFQ